jgi:hypothetical protein
VTELDEHEIAVALKEWARMKCGREVAHVTVSAGQETVGCGVNERDVWVARATITWGPKVDPRR